MANALALVADIGGTNARFALVDTSAREPALLRARSSCNADYASLQHAASQYLRSVDARPQPPTLSRLPFRPALERSQLLQAE